MRLYASSGSLRPLDERRRYLDEIRGMGFDAVKIRVKYATLEEDLRMVRDVRAAVGDDFTIGVDANQGWPVSLFRPNPDWDLERATAFARGCASPACASAGSRSRSTCTTGTAWPSCGGA